MALPNGASQTTYIDASGQKKTGYIIDGRTYTDAAGSTPVGVGSIVNTDAGQYIKTAGGSMLYSDYLERQNAQAQPALSTGAPARHSSTPGTTGGGTMPVQTAQQEARTVERVLPTEIPTAPTASPIKETSYIDADGIRRRGYIKNGVTYVDPNATVPVGVGAVVNTDNGQYIKTPTGSMLYADYLAQNGIRETTIRNEGSAVTGKGYIKDGVTYTDPMLTQRIKAGTVVDTDSGQYILTQDGSVPYSEYLQQQNEERRQKEAERERQQRALQLEKTIQSYTLPSPQTELESRSALRELEAQLAEVDRLREQAIADNDAAHARQLEQIRDRIRQQISTLNEQFQGLNRQLYVDYMRSRRDLPQRLAAMGYTGGLRESSLLGLETSYGENLAQNERERLSGVRDIESGGRDNELELDLEALRARQEAEDTAYSRAAAIRAAIVQQQNRIEDREREDAQRARTLAQNQIDVYLSAGGSAAGIPAALLEASGYDYAYVNAAADAKARELELEAQQRAQARIDSYLKATNGSAGIPKEMAVSAGYPTEYADAIAAAAASAPRLTAAQVNAAIKAGNTAPQVLSDYEYYYGAPYASPMTETGSGSGGFDNAGLSTEQVKAAQRAAGLSGSAVDGLWGPQTTAAVGMTAAQYAGNGGGAAYGYDDALKSMVAYAAAGGTANSTAGDMIQKELAGKVKEGSLTVPQAQAILDRLGV